MYSKMYFEQLQKHDPNKLWISSINIQDMINELMRRKDLKSCLMVYDTKTLDKHNIDTKFDIIYLNINVRSIVLYEYIQKSLNLLSENGYLLIDGLFPYYLELDEYQSYQAFIKARNNIKGYQYNLLWDCSYGVGVITKGEDQYATYNVDDAFNLDYSGFEYFFSLCMNPINTELFLNTLEVKKTKYKYSVLTCIFNGYEIVRDIPNPREDVEYVLVTDDFNIKSDTWKVKYIDSFFDEMSGFAKAFYVKYHPFEFVESDNFIWIDGSIQIKDDFTEEIMEPFINSNYEILELVNTIYHQGDYELNRWAENKFHGFNQEQCDLAKRLFKDEPWVDETQPQTTIYAGKNTRLLNLINNRTWDIMRRDSGNEHDITILYMPQRGKVLSKYAWNSHKVYFLDSNTLFSKYFDYCFHKTTQSQWEDWLSVNNRLENFIWGMSQNPLFPKKVKR